MKVNETIRAAAKKHNVRLWEIAERFGVSDATFSRWMRQEFAPQRRKLALKYIYEIAKEKREG